MSKILVDYAITQCSNNFNLISPFIDHRQVSNLGISKGLNPSSYDMSLAENFIEFNGIVLDPTGQKTVGEYKDFTSNKVFLKPGKMILGRSIEYFSLPENIMALFFIKSTWSRVGLLMNPGQINPGWKGQLTLEICNPTSHNIVLYANEGIVTVMFFEVDNPFESYNGFYQNQFKVQKAKTSKYTS